jgi:hypothetical protein
MYPSSFSGCVLHLPHRGDLLRPAPFLSAAVLVGTASKCHLSHMGQIFIIKNMLHSLGIFSAHLMLHHVTSHDSFRWNYHTTHNANSGEQTCHLSLAILKQLSDSGSGDMAVRWPKPHMRHRHCRCIWWHQSLVFPCAMGRLSQPWIKMG